MNSDPIKTIKRCRFFYTVAMAGLMFLTSHCVLADTPETDKHIREIVESLLKEKDEQIKKLEARIQQLENTVPNSAQPSAATLQTDDLIPANPITVPNNQPAMVQPATALETLPEKKTTSIIKRLATLSEEVKELKETAQENGLKLGGFFDLNAKTDNSSEQTFSVGSIELDLEYDYYDNVAASAALVLCGNSAGIDPVHFPSAPVAVSCGSSGPGGINAGPAGFAVAFLDYHQVDHSIPARGRIFNHQGYHIQAGRFDLPFSSDYQNYANKDRISITAPITTARMQFGGYNGDGVRSYGSWNALNYSIFWTDSMYAHDGTSLGGRLGLSLGGDVYRSHGKTHEGIEIGLSHLSDLDYDNNLRNLIYGADISFAYRLLKLQSELMWRQAQNHFIHEDSLNSVVDYGYPDEFGYHITLIADLKKYFAEPVSAFVRYGRWQPKHRVVVDYDKSLAAVSNISLLSLGFNYKFNDYMKIKFEYTDSLGTSTQEHYFDKKMGTAQMVVAF